MLCFAHASAKVAPFFTCGYSSRPLYVRGRSVAHYAWRAVERMRLGRSRSSFLGRDTRRCCYERRRRYIVPCMQVRSQSTFMLRSSSLSYALCGHLSSPRGIDHAGLRRFPGPLSALKTWTLGMRLPCSKAASAFLESRTHEPGFSVPRGTSCRKFLSSYHPCGWC